MKTATIITAHEPYFRYLTILLDTFYINVKQPHQIYIVFSNEYEEKLFRKQTTHEFNSLFIPNHLLKCRSIVNVKKLSALKTIVDEYDYIGVYDCETEYVKEVDLNDLYSEIGSRNWVKGNHASVGGNIIKKIATILGIDTNVNVITQTNNFSLYLWFQDPPVYKSEQTKQFLDWLFNRDNINEILNEYHCFDFLMYSLYNIAYNGWEVKEYSFHLDIGAVEQFRLDEDRRLKILQAFNPYWSIDRSNHHKFPNVKMIVHSDKAV
jgi:hypothetical protein